jgi:hypothetical protein
MRGTVFKHPDHIPHFATVDAKLSDGEIYEIEKRMIEDGWKPIPTVEEYFGKKFPKCGVPIIGNQHQ